MKRPSKKRVLTIIIISNKVVSPNDLIPWAKFSTKQRMGIVDTSVDAR